MESTCKDMESESSWSESSLPRVFELPREPAVVINGVPEISPEDNTGVLPDSGSDPKSPGDVGFGEWLEGREVRKLFGEQFYSGVVTQFDKESGWYRVVYEDGDFEDLDWLELEDVLLPLDITVPLKTLALKIIKNQKPVDISERSMATGPLQKHKTKNLGRKGKDIAEEASVTNLNSPLEPI